METYYDQLMNLRGADELKAIINKWETLSRNIEKYPLDAPIVLPDLFLYTRSGNGNTTFLSLLAGYLDSKKNLMSFYGDVKFLEFKLDYCSPDSKFSEIYRFMDAVRVAAGFRNEFKGIVRINVNDWLGHHKEKYFREFLNYLNGNTKSWLVILTVSSVDKLEKAKEMESVVSMYLRIETVTLSSPTDQEFVDYSNDFLAKYGFKLEESAEAVILESISVLRNNVYFNGYHTVADMCNDIVYSLFSKAEANDRLITADMISDFSADSDYIKRTIVKSKQRATLGFY